jgi:hypothetical protein
VRRRKAERHGGAAPHTNLNTGHAEQLAAADDEILEVHEALEVLAGIDARLVGVVEMRYFGGLTDVEIGRALGVTDRTVRRDWDRAEGERQDGDLADPRRCLKGPCPVSTFLRGWFRDRTRLSSWMIPFLRLTFPDGGV